MIEKLKVVIKPEDWKLPVDELEMRCLKNLLSKVDELVDAVNELQENQNTYWTDIAEIKKELLQTPDENYAYNYINIAADAYQQIQTLLEQKDVK